MRRVRRSTLGFTLLEVAVGASVLILVVLTTGSFLTASHGVVAGSRAEMRATAELRRNLEALANVIREVDTDTLSGFGANWQTDNPTFRRVLGADLDQRVYGETEELRWVAANREVDGVSEPGAVFLVTSTGPRLLADRVPRGGFSLRQDGRTVALHLTTYYVTGEARTEFVTGNTAIQMRN